MKLKSLLFISLFISVTISAPFEYCEDKAIIRENSFELIHSLYADKTEAYNEVASCISLKPRKHDTHVCCYLKIKFENELADERFTHKGCYPVSVETLLSEDGIEDLIDALEEYSYRNPDVPVNEEDNQINYITVNLDCSSKFIQLTGLALFLFLL